MNFIPTKLIMLLMPAPILFGATVVASSSQSMIIIGDNPVLRAWCIIGAMCGGFLSVAIFPVDDSCMGTLVRRLSIKWIASTIIGYIVTPIFVRYFSIEPISDTLLAISAGFGFFGITILHIVSPRLVKWIKKWMERWFD